MSLVHRTAPLAVAAILVACADSSDRARAQSLPAARVACANRTIDGADFTVCEIPAALVGRIEIAPAPAAARMEWTVARLDASLRDSAKRVAVAMNAGIFGTDGRPLGLLVSHGRESIPLNRSPGRAVPAPGSICDIANFYCPPNGVFYVADGRAAVVTTAEFARRSVRSASIQAATQSGPMLVVDGQPAREFPAAWRKRIMRNAVCARADGAVLFVLGRDQTHASLAEALRGPLGCRDALYLDGNVSDLFTGTGALPALDAYGAILYIARPVNGDDPTIAAATGSIRDPARPRAYSMITARVGGGESGGALEMETPTHAGWIGFHVAQIGAGPAALGFDWAVHRALASPVTLRAGLRAGIEGSRATTGVMGAIDVAFAPRLAASLAVGRTITGDRAKTAPVSLALFASISAARPAWLSR
jgi:uncharacterized protein YigE (DUF2233 family)